MKMLTTINLIVSQKDENPRQFIYIQDIYGRLIFGLRECFINLVEPTLLKEATKEDVENFYESRHSR